MCLLTTKEDQKEYHKDVNQLVVSERRRHSEKPLIHKDIERLVDGHTLNFLLDKKLMNIGTIKMKYDNITGVVI